MTIDTPDQPGHLTLLALIEGIKATVEAHPQDVTPEHLKLMQGTVAKMQKAIGNTTAPHPELEQELLQELQLIKPKIIEGTVTKAEADHLHSLEARAHGHTEKGGLTSIAQSVAAKRERQLSLSLSLESGSEGEAQGKEAVEEGFMEHHPEFPMRLKSQGVVSVGE